MTGAGIVIRCPNCGTTQPALGECEACHEAEVRYFCTNHVPGRWLDGAACAACGARYGVRAEPSPLPPTPPFEATRRRPAQAPLAPRSRTARPTDDAPAAFDDLTDVPTPTRDVLGSSGEGPAGPPGMGARRWPREDRWPGIPGVRVVRVGAGSMFGCFARLVLAFVAFAVLSAVAFFGSCGIY